METSGGKQREITTEVLNNVASMRGKQLDVPLSRHERREKKGNNAVPPSTCHLFSSLEWFAYGVGKKNIPALLGLHKCDCSARITGIRGAGLGNLEGFHLIFSANHQFSETLQLFNLAAYGLVERATQTRETYDFFLWKFFVDII